MSKKSQKNTTLNCVLRIVFFLERMDIALKKETIDNSVASDELFDNMDDVFSIISEDLKQTSSFDKSSQILLDKNKNPISTIEYLPDDDYEQLKITTTSAVEKSVLTRDRVSYALLDKSVINKGEQSLSVGKIGKAHEPVLTKIVVSLDPDELEKMSNNMEFTYFDKSVFDAICSLLMVGNKAMSLSMIARAMLGKKSPYHPGSELLEEIDKSINKLERIKISIDMSEEIARFNQLKNEDVSKAVLKSRFFECRRLDTVIKGNAVDVIMFTQEPILLKYAKKRAQLSSINNSLLDTPTKKTKNLITIQSYLLQRINMLKLNKKLPQCIMFKSIYSLFDDDVVNMSDRAIKDLYVRARKAVLSILEFWKKEGFIKNYSLTTKGRSYYKIDIEC